MVNFILGARNKEGSDGNEEAGGSGETVGCASKHCLRPRLAKALEEEGLLTVEDTGALCGFKVARLTGEGVDFCLEHFEE